MQHPNTLPVDFHPTSWIQDASYCKVRCKLLWSDFDYVPHLHIWSGLSINPESKLECIPVQVESTTSRARCPREDALWKCWKVATNNHMSWLYSNIRECTIHIITYLVCHPMAWMLGVHADAVMSYLWLFPDGSTRCRV